jgi:hypothetical protein
MVYFQTKNLNLVKFWRAFEWKMLLYFMPIWSILWSFGNFVVIWYIFSPALVHWVKKNLATLARQASRTHRGLVPGVVVGAVHDLEDDGGRQDDEDEDGGDEPPSDLPVNPDLHARHLSDVLKKFAPKYRDDCYDCNCQ